MNVSSFITFAAIFPIEGTKQGKLAHLFIGIVFAMIFWYVLEKQYRNPAMNPILLLVGCLWGACGLFFFRWFFIDINIPILKEKWFYVAFPDWDILVLGIGAHRNLFFHSTIFPILVMIVAVWKKVVWLRDFGIGLTLGISAHLVWDLITVYRYPWNYIRHLDGYAGALWVLGNVIVGLFLAYYLVGRMALPIRGRQGEPLT